MNATSYIRKHWLGLTAVFGVLAVMAVNIYVANQVSVVLPMVDGWAVWNRVILFNAGAMSWKDYLFKPHGAHLHSIIYLLAWFDYRFSDADQTLMRFFSLAAVTVFAAAVSWLVWTWGTIHQRSAWLKIAAVVATAALLTSLIDNETLIQPFQAVLSISRLFYFALLGAIVVALVQQKPWLYAIAIAISMVAVSFHGSGYIFTGLVIVAHLLLTRRRLVLLAGLLPLAAVFTFQKLFSDGGGELGQLGKVLTPGAVLAFIQGASAYFAMPFRALRGVLGDLGLVTLGFVMMMSTGVLTFLSLLQVLREGRGVAIFWKQKKTTPPANTIKMEVFAIVFLTGLFLLLSAAAAAVFWIVRTSGPGHLPAYMEVFVSTRYTAYATLALVMLIGYALTLKRTVATPLTVLLSVVFLLTALWPTARIDRIYLADDQLNRAAAALSVGISPLHPEAEVVWPQASTDWYWSTNLPKTVAQLRLEQKSIWKTLPPLGASVDSALTRVPLTLVRVRPLTTSPSGRCGIEGTIPNQAGQPSASTLFPLVNGQREVVGFTTMMRHLFDPQGRRLDGFILCNEAPLQAPLFLAAPTARWHIAKKQMPIYASSSALTDDIWLNGISRSVSVFIMNSEEFKISTGNILRFADDQLRVVTQIKHTGDLLEVTFDGGPLDGGVVGNPEKIEILD